MDFFAVWRMFWGDLNTPDSFHDRPYEGGMNQAVHVIMGAATVVVICLVWAIAYGEMPYKIPTWCVVTGGYAMIIEWFKQGWKGADSILDTYFWGLGAALPLVSLSEVAFRPEIKLVPNAVEGLIGIGVTVLSLAVYVYPRARRKWGQ